MISRRGFLAGTAVFPLAVLAQQTAMRRLGSFAPSTPAAFAEAEKECLEALRQQGFEEGRNLVVDYRYGYGKPETYPEIAKELVARKPDCIFTAGIDTLRALRQATTTIPIVMGTIDADPVKEGLADSLSRPGKNVTGLSGIAWELAGKRLELLREIVPKAARLAVVTDLRSPAAHAHLRETEAAARSLNVRLQLHDVKDADSVGQVFRDVRETRPDALFVIAVGAINTHRAQIIRNAITARLPAIYSNIASVVEGGLIAYSPNLIDQWRRAAVYVSRIFKGAKPSEMPIEQPRVFELVVNLKTAKAMGIAIPQSILGRADRVIE